MSRMIDLSVFENATMPVRLPDGHVLHLSKPTQRLVIEMLGFREMKEDSTAEEITAALDTITRKILCTNENGEIFTAEYVERDLNMQMKIALLNAYSAFITEVQSDPNS